MAVVEDTGGQQSAGLSVELYNLINICSIELFFYEQHLVCLKSWPVTYVGVYTFECVGQKQASTVTSR